MKTKLAIAFLTLFTVLLFSLPLFSLTAVHVNELSYLSEPALAKRLDSFKGKNMFWLLVSRGIQKQLGDYQQISTLQLQLRLPNQLQLHIQEKDAWLSCMSEGKTTLIAEDGSILSKGGDHSLENPKQLMVVKGIAQHYFTDDSISPSLLAHLKRLDSLARQYFPSVSLLLEQESFHSWQLILFDHLQVKLGTLDGLDDKFERLSIFLNMLDEEKYSTISYIDLRLDDKLLVSQ